MTKKNQDFLTRKKSNTAEEKASQWFVLLTSLAAVPLDMFDILRPKEKRSRTALGVVNSQWFGLTVSRLVMHLFWGPYTVPLPFLKSIYAMPRIGSICLGWRC